MKDRSVDNPFSTALLVASLAYSATMLRKHLAAMTASKVFIERTAG